MEEDGDPSLVVVKLEGGSPWGFSLKGGSEHHCPLTVARVGPNGKAALAGLVPDDIVKSINDKDCPSHNLAVSLVKETKATLIITVKRCTLDNKTAKMTEIYRSIPEETDRGKGSYKDAEMMVHDRGFPQKQPFDPDGSDVVVTRRSKSGNGSQQPRPKTWHNGGGMRHHQELENRIYEKIPDVATTAQSYNQSQHGDFSSSGSSGKSFESYNTFKSDSHSVSHQEESIYANMQEDYRKGYYSNKENFEDGFRIQPAETYPKVVMAMQVQNAQQRGIMGNHQDMHDLHILHTSQSDLDANVVNLSTVSKPEKQYAKSAIVSGEKKDPPPLPKRVDSHTRTHQLSGQAHMRFGLTASEHAKSFSWPVTLTSNTPTQSSVISPMSLPPVKLSPSQEDVNLQGRRSYKSKPTQSETISTVSEFELYTAKPFTLDLPTDTNSRFPTAEISDGAELSSTWRIGNYGPNSPPSPPTRDTDPAPPQSTSGRGPRYQTNDPLMKEYASYLEECLNQEENMKRTVVSDESISPVHEPYSAHARSAEFLHSGQSQYSKLISVTAPVPSKYPPQEDRQYERETLERMNRKNSLHTQSNERTWRNPNEFSKPPSITNPLPESRDVSEKTEWKELVQLSQQAHLNARTNSELMLKGNAPRNRTPINPQMLEGLEASDLKSLGNKERSFSKLIKGNGRMNFEESRDSRRSADIDSTSHLTNRNTNWQGQKESLSLDDQRKLDQLSSSNSLLTQLQRDNQRSQMHSFNQGLKFFGGEDFGRHDGGDVTSEPQRASPVHFPSGHYRSGSYQGETRPDIESIRSSSHHRSSSCQLASQSEHSAHTTSTNKQRGVQKDFKDHKSTGYGDYETPDVSMESKLRRTSQEAYYSHKASNVGGSEQRLIKTEQYPVESESTKKFSDIQKMWDSKLSLDGRGDHKHSQTDSDKYRKISRGNHQRKVSDPKGAIRKERKVSDASDKEKIEVALKGFVQRKNSQTSIPSSSQGSSPYSSRPGSLPEGPMSPYGYRGDHYASSSSLAPCRSTQCGLQNRKQGMFSSQSSIPGRSGRVSDAFIRYSSGHPADNRRGSLVTRSASVSGHPSSQPLVQNRGKHIPAHPPRRLSGEVSFNPQKSPPSLMSQHRTSSMQNLSVDVTTPYYRSPLDSKSSPSFEKGNDKSSASPSNSSSHQLERSTATVDVTSSQPRGSRFPSVSDRSEEPSSTRSRAKTDPDILSTLPSYSPASHHSPFPYERSNPQVEVHTRILKYASEDLMSPPPPSPPPDVVSPMDQDISPFEDFPPPPPELLNTNQQKTVFISTESERLNSNPPKKDNITVIRVDSTNSLPVQPQEPSVLITNSPSEESAPLPDLQSDNKLTDLQFNVDKNDYTVDKEKTEVETLEEKSDLGSESGVKNQKIILDEKWVEESHDDRNIPSNRQLEEKSEPARESPFEETFQTDDPLVISVLQSLSFTESFSLKELLPERRGRKGSRVPIPHVAVQDKSKNMNENETKMSSISRMPTGLSSYLQISAAKAILQTKARGLQGKDIMQSNNEELRKTTEHLIDRINGKVTELRETQQDVEEETQLNNELGRQVDEYITHSCSTSNYTKYCTYIGDLDKVTKLNLNLSRKLEKLDSILSSLGENGDKEERINLEKMRSKYASQSEDAKMLEDSIKERHGDISDMLQPCLSTEEHEDFVYFTTMRPRLLIAAQKVKDKIDLGEEQLQALRDSLSISEESPDSRHDSEKDENGNCDEMEKSFV